MNVTQAKKHQPYRVISVEGKEKNIQFLYSLGCHPGQKLSIVSKLAGNYILNILDGRYAIDGDLAKCIEIEAE